MISRYLVIAEVGRGGMGVVMRAYDPKLQREVALKCVRGSESPEAIARLVREARAMAKLNDAHVVHVYDVDVTATDGVLIAMEYVPGTDLRHWLDSTRRPWQAVVRTFLAAGRGLLAAHRAELLHRDFKPANVIVEDADEPRVVKVTDFGLARWSAAEGSGSGDAPSGDSMEVDLTSPGSLMGTPGYMAPEQHRGAPLDARTDQFAFCVALWEGLVGRRPFKGNARELVRAKNEGPPAWPGDAVAPRAIVAAIERGLAPRPEDRWPGMASLLDVLERAVSGNRSGRRTIALGVAAVALVGGAVGVTTARDELCSGSEEQLATAWNDEIADAAAAAFSAEGRTFAIAAWERTRTTLDDYTARWVSTHRDACEATRVRGVQSEAAMDLRMACLRRARLELAAIGEILADADASVPQRADALVASLPPLEHCDDVERLGADVRPPPAEIIDDVDAIAALVAQARASRLAWRFDVAAATIEPAVATARALDHPPILAEALQEHGRVVDLLQRRDEAIASHAEALRIAMQEGQWVVASAAAVSLTFVHGEEHRPDAARAYGDIARALAGRTQKADEVAGSVANALAATHQAAGEYAEAEREFRAALEAYTRAGAHQHEGDTHSNLGQALHAQGRYEEGLVEFQRGLEILRARLGPDHPDTANAHGNVGDALIRLGRSEEGLAELRTAIAVNLAALGPDHPRTTMHRAGLALGLVFADRKEEASAEFGRLYEDRLAVLGPDHDEVLTLQANFGTSLRELGKLEEAEHHLRSVHAAWKQKLGPEHVRVASMATNLAQVLLDRKHRAEAVPLLEHALEVQRKGAAPPRSKGATAFELARALWAPDGDRARSDALCEEAIAAFEAAGPAGEEDLANARKWRADRDE